MRIVIAGDLGNIGDGIGAEVEGAAAGQGNLVVGVGADTISADTADISGNTFDGGGGPLMS